MMLPGWLPLFYYLDDHSAPPAGPLCTRPRWPLAGRGRHAWQDRMARACSVAQAWFVAIAGCARISRWSGNLCAVRSAQDGGGCNRVVLASRLAVGSGTKRWHSMMMIMCGADCAAGRHALRVVSAGCGGHQRQSLFGANPESLLGAAPESSQGGKGVAAFSGGYDDSAGEGGGREHSSRRVERKPIGVGWRHGSRTCGAGSLPAGGSVSSQFRESCIL